MTETTPRPWKVTVKWHDGIRRPAANFTVSHQGTFVAAFANEQDATDAARAVNAAPGLADALATLLTLRSMDSASHRVEAAKEAAREALKLWEQ